MQVECYFVYKMSPIPLPCVRNESEREVSVVKSWGGGLNRNPGEVPATSWIYEYMYVYQIE